MSGTGMLPASDEDLYRYYNLRNTLPADSPLHAQYGPLEHQDMMREVAGRNPLMAVPMGLVGIPAYTLGKATGMIHGTRSPASWDEMTHAYRGLGQGIEDYNARIAPQVAHTADPDYVPQAVDWMSSAPGHAWDWLQSIFNFSPETKEFFESRAPIIPDPDAPPTGMLRSRVNASPVPNPSPALPLSSSSGVRG